MAHFSDQFNRYRETSTRFQVLGLRESIGEIASLIKIMELNRNCLSLQKRYAAFLLCPNDKVAELNQPSFFVKVRFKQVRFEAELNHK